MEQTIRINPDRSVAVTLSCGLAATLREPLAKDMDGLSQDLIKIKHTQQVQQLIGRISTPQITKLQYAKLSISDAAVLNAALDFFSAPPTARQEMEAAFRELGYLSESESEPQTSPAGSQESQASTN